MIIKNLKLFTFRSYEYLDVDFDSKINFLTGINGAGKTNVLEAISLLSFGKSFVTSQENNCIAFNHEFAKINANVEANKVNRMSIVISNEGKKISINDQDIKKISSMATKILTVTFAPKDVRIFKDSPSERRKFIDVSLSMLSLSYISNLSLYKELLKRRNLLLKQEFDLIHIEAIDTQIIPISYEIIKARKIFINEINKKIKEIYDYFEMNDEVKMEYISFMEFEEDKQSFIKKMNLLLKDNYEADIKRKSSTIGIHHDDIVFMLNGNNIAIAGSQGQNRIASLVIKLALARIIEEYVKEKPVLLLDDVLSELDENFQSKLGNLLSNMGQVFITGTEVPKTIKDCTEYIVSNHTLRRM